MVGKKPFCHSHADFFRGRLAMNLAASATGGLQRGLQKKQTLPITEYVMLLLDNQKLQVLPCSMLHCEKHIGVHP